MAQTFPLISGANQVDGRAWTNCNQDTGTPTSPSATHQDSRIVVSGTIHSNIAAGAEVQVVSYSGTPATGEVLKLGLGGTVYSHARAGVETLQDCLDALVTASAANTVWTAVRSGDTIECTAATAGITTSLCTGQGLCTKVVGTYTGSPAIGSTLTLNLQSHQYVHTAATTSLATALTALVALAANDNNWAVTKVGSTVVCRSKYPDDVPAQVSFGVTDGTLAVTSASTVGNLTATSAITVPGTAAIAASEFKVMLNGVEYSYTVTPGDTLNDAAIALDVLIAIDYTTDGPPAAETINFYGLGGVEVTCVDSSTGGAIASFSVQSPATSADPVNSASGSYWRTTKYDTVQIIAELVTGTSYDVKLWGYNAAANLWAQISSNTIDASQTLNYSIPYADGIFIELGTYIGNAVATTTLVGSHA